MNHQKQSYKQKKQIMKKNNIHKLFVYFITDLLYKKYRNTSPNLLYTLHSKVYIFISLSIYKLKTLDFDIDKLIYDFNKNLSNHYIFLNKIKLKLNIQI